MVTTALVVGAFALLLSGCGQSRVDLPTTNVESCIGYGISVVLRGDAADPDVAWIEGYESHNRTAVVWPTGFTARFDPDLEILDESGRVVLREGDYIDGTCGVVSKGRELLAPPFLALRLDCGRLPILDCQIAVGATARANGWPDREIAEIQFLDSEAQYRLVYEDGTEVSGQAPMP
jgi:hypothetical protein